ncbi:dodecin family protein [Hyphomonas sp.]|uniref:dodecin family protein n=1 Tax=Hyphomonas sp. TaxID=87 RepID=UPI00352936E6
MSAASSFCRQITGTSDVSVDDAISRALSVARDGYGEPDWFDVVTARGFISKGHVTHYQVTLNLGFENTSKNRATDDFYFHRACGGVRRPRNHHTIETRL